MIEIRVIDREHKEDINIPNQPFPLFGKMIPGCVNGIWSYTIEKFADKSEMCFPDENYDYDKMAENSIFIGAYDNNVCIGLAIIQKGSGYLGLYTQGQDNNLGACLFYIKNHFCIGGFDTNVYKGTKQEGKSDIIFYCDC